MTCLQPRCACCQGLHAYAASAATANAAQAVICQKLQARVAPAVVRVLQACAGSMCQVRVDSRAAGCCRCVLDLTPQKVDAMHLAMLGNFASMVVKEIERDRVKRVASDAASQANNSLKQVCSRLGSSWPLCSPAALVQPDACLA